MTKKDRRPKHQVPVEVSRFVVNPVRARLSPVATASKYLPKATESRYRVPHTGFLIALTEWYSEESKPTIVGVYLVRHDVGVSRPIFRVGFAYFDGTRWSPTCPTPIAAERSGKAGHNGASKKQWRGMYRDLFAHERASYCADMIRKAEAAQQTAADLGKVAENSRALASAVAVRPKNRSVTDIISGAAAALADSSPVPLDKTVATLSGKPAPSPEAITKAVTEALPKNWKNLPASPSLVVAPKTPLAIHALPPSPKKLTKSQASKALGIKKVKA